MIKDILEANDNVTPNQKELEVLKQNFPSCFKADGSFDITRFSEFLKDKVNITHEGYELKFLGKSYAKLLASLDTETLIVPDEDHNSLPENKNSQNIYISGDNLDALKHLLKSYSGKVKCIYIDPPYNTGSDGFVYKDKFEFKADELARKLSIGQEQAEKILDLTSKGSASHSAWMTFMYPRLQLAREMLTEDGAILINIDDNEQANLKILCDDIFGEQCFLGTFIWFKKLTGGYDNDNINTQHDYILAYSKSNSFAINLRAEESKYKFIDPKTGKKFKWDSLWNTGGLTYSKTMDYPIKAPDGSDIYPIGERGVSFWVWSKEKVEKERDELRFVKDDDGNWKVYKKVFQSDGLIPGSITLLEKMEVGGNTNATQEIKDLFGAKVFDYPKPTKLIRYLIDRVVNNNDIVMDFFAGSSTTADAVLNYSVEHKYLNLHYILVQLPEPLYKIVNGKEEPIKTGAVTSAFNLGYRTIDQIGMDRIKRAANQIRKEHPDTKVDLGFKHYTLKEIEEKSLLDRIYDFTPDAIIPDTSISDSIGLNTILTTWLVSDGYGFNNSCKALELDNYTAYHCDNHLYLINSGLSSDAVKQLMDKYSNDADFSPQNVVIFGYNFNYVQTENLKTNFKILKDTEKNLKINLQIRY